ncbi:MAG: sodium/proline symporter PutP [Chromatiales bacterium]
MPAEPDVVATNPPIVLAFACYLLLMLAIGYVGWRRTQSLADYILGGRRLGRWVAALSAGASDMSGWLLLGLPGYAYASGLESGWLVVGLLAGTWLNWRLVAERLRRYTERAHNALTLPDFFERRFADASRSLRLVSALFILVFFTFYTGSGLVAGGKLFNAVFGVDYLWAVAIGAAVIVAYTFMGGFLAVAWTDLVQALLMLFALLIVPVAVLQQIGGPEDAAALVEARNAHLLSPFTDSGGGTLSLIAVLSLLGWGLGYFGQPHILARFMAIADPDQVPKARRIAVTWSGLGMAGAVLVGIAGIGYLEPALTGADAEKVFIHLVGAVFHPLPAGVLLAAILAAIMSTADSQLLVASSALTEDFYRALYRRGASERELVWVGRGAVAAIALLALFIARDADSRVLDLVAYAWAGFGAAFGPVVLLGLFWRRMTAGGALAGMLVGGITVIVWKQLEGGLFDLYEIIPGAVLATVAILTVSLLGRPPPAPVTALFDEVSARGGGG